LLCALLTRIPFVPLYPLTIEVIPIILTKEAAPDYVLYKRSLEEYVQRIYNREHRLAT